MTAYYNEIDPYAAQWLRNLISANLIADGPVDERSIVDVQPDDLKGFTQCHFFAGLGGWSRAARLAGWPDDRPLWTGSCPCQPFSLAGKRKGFQDERHLWPEWQRLIAKRRPPVCFGEQVASASAWLARVRSDLEALDYAVGAIPMEAASAGACQLRDRFWFVASLPGAGLFSPAHPGVHSGEAGAGAWHVESQRHDCELRAVAGESGESERKQEYPLGAVSRESARTDGSGVGAGHHPVSHLANLRCSRLEEWQGQPGDDGPQQSTAQRDGVLDLVSPAGDGWGEGWTESELRGWGFTAAVASGANGAQWIQCPDGKFRRLPPPRVRWLGNGIPARVAKLRAFGNAIFPEAAAQVIRAFMECAA